VNMLRGKKGGEFLLAGFLEDRQIAAIDDVHTRHSRLRHEVAEMWIQFGRAARDVQRYRPLGC